MAYASIRTLIPLDDVARFLQIDPLHFNGVDSTLRVKRSSCDDVWSQHDWQMTGRASRESLAMALKQAEDTVVSLLGYSPLPTWFLEEEHQIVKPASPELFFTNSSNVRGQQKSVIADFKYVLEGGRRATSVIELSSPVVYSDPNGDNYKELATVSVATVITDPEEISVFYPGKGGAEEWEIRPVTIEIGAGIAVITFQKYQVPLENLVETLVGPEQGNNYKSIDGDDDANFLQTVDVYRVYNDPSQQLLFYTENGCVNCGGSGCSVCSATSESGCLYVRDEELGILAYTRADWNTDTGSFDLASYVNCREPDKVKIWYHAGYRDKKRTMPKREMDITWERLIIFYALTLMDTDVGWCDNTKRIYAYQLEEMNKNSSGKSYSVPDRILNNPLGVTRAALNLWRQITGPTGRNVRNR